MALRRKSPHPQDGTPAEFEQQQRDSERHGCQYEPYRKLVKLRTAADPEKDH
jgi:hypothetical protein